MSDAETKKEHSSRVATCTFKDIKDDPGFLVAKGRFKGNTDEEKKNARTRHVKSLASAIFMAMSNHGYATIRAIGESASYNAVKAIAIASGHCKPKGIDLCFEVSFDEGNIGKLRKSDHVNSVTAIVFSLKGYKAWTEDKKGETHAS